MKKNEVEIDRTYVAKVSGAAKRVRIVCDHPLGGWFAVNESTGRQVRIRTSARLKPLDMFHAYSLMTEEERQAVFTENKAKIAAAKERLPFVDASIRSARYGFGSKTNANKRGYIMLFA